MLVRLTSQYALRAMAWLALLPATASARSADIAKATAIPTPYLAKILRKLVIEGLLVGQRGHHGGYRLARSPAQIRFADILAVTECEEDAERCAFGWGRCDPVRPCPLHPAWQALEQHYSAWSANTTLADIVRAHPGRPNVIDRLDSTNAHRSG